MFELPLIFVNATYAWAITPLFYPLLSVAVEVALDAALGCLFKLCCNQLNSGNALVGGDKFVQLGADVLHQLGQFLACNAQLVH